MGEFVGRFVSTHSPRHQLPSSSKMGIVYFCFGLQPTFPVRHTTPDKTMILRPHTPTHLIVVGGVIVGCRYLVDEEGPSYDL